MHRRTLLLLLLLLVVARGLLVVSVADVFFYEEEGAKGTAAKALIDGLGIPRWQVNYAYHEGGGFLVTHLASLFFRLVGPSALALKLTALVTTSILLVVGFRFTAESFGAKAAAIFGLFFVLCPEAYLRYSLLAIGTHFESLILVALILRYGARLLFHEDPPLRDWALLGLCSGFGAYVSLQSAPAIATVALALLLRRRRRLIGPGVSLAALGFAVGGIPLWWMMSHVGTAALRVRSNAPDARGLRGWDAIREILRPFVETPEIWSWARLVATAVTIAVALRISREEPGRRLRTRCGLIAVYLAAYGVSYAGSGYALPFEGLWSFWTRLSPLWFFSTCMLAGCAAYLIDQARPRGRELALGAIALTLAAGIADLAGLLRRARPATPIENLRMLSTTKGYDYIEYFDKLADHLPESDSARYAVLSRFQDDPKLLLPSAMHSLFEHSGRSLEGAVGFARDFCGPEWKTALLGLGLQAAPRYGHDIPEAIARVQTAPPETREALAEAVGRVAFGLKLTPEKIDEQARLDLPPGLKDAFLRGGGWRIYQMHPLRPDLGRQLVDRQPEDTRSALWRGYIEAAAANTIR